MRAPAAMVALALACGACVAGSGGERVAVDDIPDIAVASGLAAREFETTLNLFGTEVRVAGLAQDAYRYAGTVFVEGRPLFEEVVFDDARYLRLLEPDAIREAAASTDGASALLGGGWVVDPTGAPPEFGEGSTVEEPDPVLAATSPTFLIDLLGSSTLLREVRYLEQVPALLRTGEPVREWNTDAADYLEARDLFPPNEQDGTRFDALPKSFDPGAAISGLGSLEQFFRTSAVWVRSGVITRVETVFGFPDPNDSRYDAVFRSFQPPADPANPASAELSQRGAELLRALADLKLTETHTFRPPPGDAAVEAPPGAKEVDLATLLARMTGAPVALDGAELPPGIGGLVSGSGS